MSAILFLLILVFNLYGYRVVLAYVERSGDVALEQKLDKNDYNNEELISVKTVLHLPYYSSSPEFERTYGSVTIDGVLYEYVKKRVYNDTLELLCLPNKTKTKLHDIKNDITKSTAGANASLPLKKGTTTLKISLPEYCQQPEALPSFAAGLHTRHLLLNETCSLTGYRQQQERPPRAAAFAS